MEVLNLTKMKRKMCEKFNDYDTYACCVMDSTEDFLEMALANLDASEIADCIEHDSRKYDEYFCEVDS